MNGKAAQYRGLAEKFRRDAEDVTLSNLRQTNLNAAERWDLLAEECERSAKLLHGSRPDWIF